MLASALATSPLFAFAAITQASHATPDQMFVISTPSAGVVDYRGTGSATFTNTKGSTDSVTIGTNSSFGVSATGTNTSDYTSSASSTLDLAATTSLNHATGTATQAFNNKYSTSTTGTQLTDAISKITSVLTTSSSGEGSNVLNDLKSSIEAQATAKAKAVVGEDKSTAGSSGVDYSADQNAYDAAYKAVYNEEYANAYSTVNNASTTTYKHDLGVTGIGTVTNIDAKESSTFSASTQRLDGSTTMEGGTGSANAAMTNSNTTFANTSETTSATAFAQAFNGGNAANMGALTLGKVATDGSGNTTVTATQTTTNTIVYTADGSGNLTAN